MAYYLGIDAGGTKTECALACDDTVLARATGGSIKVMHTSDEDAGRHLDEVLWAVSKQAKIELTSIACTCVGLSGISVARVADWVRQALSARVGGDVLLCGDEVIALDAAFFGGPGVLVVAGTGSNIVARSIVGELIHVGGWGPVLTDEGSGNWIGKQAVRAIFDSLDEGKQPPLLEAVKQAWGLPDVSSLIGLVNQLPGPNFSKLTPLIVRCAEHGDRDAAKVLCRAGMELGRLAGLALGRLHALEPADENTFNIAYTGSVLAHIAPVREAMCATIRQEFPDAQIQGEAVDPVEGALWQARRRYQRSRNVASQ